MYSLVYSWRTKSSELSVKRKHTWVLFFNDRLLAIDNRENAANGRLTYIVDVYNLLRVEGKNILNGRYELSTVLTSGSAVKPPFSMYDSTQIRFSFR